MPTRARKNTWNATWRRMVFENILPYLGIEKEAAQETDAVRTMDQVEYLLSAE